jgi:threonine/homoserine/homoserine lactone efflux protein
MFGIQNYEVFLVASILLNITPGTDTMYIVSRSISQGRAAGVYSALGISAGVVIHTLLAAFGLSILLMQSVFLFQLVKYAGVIYLVYLGIQMLRSKEQLKGSKEVAVQSNQKLFLQGLITNVTNPKVALFFLAFLPQFIETSAGSVTPIPFLLLGLSFAVTGGSWCFILAFVSSMASSKLRSSPKAATVLHKLTGMVFIAMGVSLLKAKPA